MREVGRRWVALAAFVAVGTSASGRAQPTAAAITWEVPCGDQWAFVAAVADLGGSFEGFDVMVGVGETDSGSFLGRLSIRRGDEALAQRELDDASCEDVIDALAIAAALALRSLPPAPAPSVLSEPAPTAAVDDEQAPPLREAEVEPPPESTASVRFMLGASLRGGLGPTPGLALAPVLALGLELERVLVVLHVAYWPEAGRVLADGQRGVLLWALTPTIELGYRIGDALSVIPAVVIEPSVVLARGVGVPSPRSEATLELDAGASVSLTYDVAGVRLFVRGDVLFGLLRPIYGVDREPVFAAPDVRGTGGAGVLLSF